jgi:uncharacterized repeat protein (TIGR03803 family)
MRLRNYRLLPAFACNLALAVACLSTGFVAHTASASYRFKVLYHLCPHGSAVCTDGTNPVAGLIMDNAGNLYGTTEAGGVPRPCGFLYPEGCGTVFELTPDAARASGWAETILYRFCRKGGGPAGVCPDGDTPAAGLTVDAAGNLYGTTRLGGGTYNAGAGVVFELKPNAFRTSWKETVLHSFCTELPNCTDGATPYAGLIMDGAGNLYGTTELGGGTETDRGVVFELTPNASRTSWTETVLYSFCAQTNCADGAGSAAGMIMDTAGNLYGTAGGGANSEGIVFELTPNASRTAWTETVLYSFCASGGTCPDGAGPFGRLIMDAAGNLYGTTVWGGNVSSISSSGAGVVYKLTPNASRTSWTETVLYSFCAQANCTDGGQPEGELIVDATGNLYGTTSNGGRPYDAGGAGVVFQLAPNGSRTSYTETVLHYFCSRGTACSDGRGSSGSGLIMDGSGNLYGATVAGGINNAGVVFELVKSP